MNKHPLLPIFTGLLLAWFCTGCEISMFGDGVDDAAKNTTTTYTATPASTPTDSAAKSIPAPTPAVDGRDQLDISGAKSLGTHAGISAQNAAITRTLYAASKEGDNVSLSFEPLNWPTQGGGKKVDGGVWLFWVEGSQVVGGLFDFHGVGQTSKTLENVYGGYLSGKKPAKGQTIYFALVSLDGKQRTNVAQSQTTW